MLRELLIRDLILHRRVLLAGAVLPLFLVLTLVRLMRREGWKEKDIERLVAGIAKAEKVLL